MEKRTATSIFESLSSGVRLDAFRMLVKKGPSGMVAGEIAEALAVPPTNLSFHLKALTQAQLLSVDQEGRFLRYRANIPLMLDLVAYLTEECCSGDRGACVDLRAASRVPPGVLVPIVLKSRRPKKRPSASASRPRAGKA